MNRILKAIREVFVDDRPDSEKAGRRAITTRIRNRIMIFLAVLLLLSAAFVLAHGNYIALYYRSGIDGIRPEEIEVSFREEGIVRVRNISTKGSVVRVDMEPVGSGIAEATVKIDDSGYTEHINSRGPVLFQETTGNFPCWQLVVLDGFLMCLWCSLVFLNEYRRMKGSWMFSYTAIFLMGISVFFFVIALGTSIILVFLIRDPTAYNFGKIMDWSQTVMMYFTLVTAPGLLVFSAALCISNIQLIRKEGFRFVNLLGIILSFVIVAGMLAGIVMVDILDFKLSYNTLMYIVNTYYGIFSYMICLLIGVFLIFFRIARHRPEYDKDFIVILGCAIRKDGTLYPLIRGRVDKALAFAAEQEAAGGPRPIFIPSGGKGGDEPMSEGEAMANYLVSRGIPEERIFPETRSVNTKENMRFSSEIAEENCPGGKGAFSTTNYHVFRSGVIAGTQGLELDGMGSPTKWYFWPNALIREFIGLLVDDLREIVLFSLLIVTFCTAIFMIFS